MRVDSPLIPLAVATALLIACKAPPDPRRTNFKIEGKADGRAVMVQYDEKSGRLKRIELDQNKNGRMDTFSYWDATRVHRIEIDADEDSRIERWEHYDERNRLEKVGTSSKNDGVEDTWSFVPDAEGTVRIDLDLNRDGVLDKREYWTQAPDGSDRRLARIELEFDKVGSPGRRLSYRADGSFEKTEKLR